MSDKELGDKVKYLRRNLGISQEDLAERLDISRTHMGHIEQGRRKPSLALLKKLAKILNVRVKDVIPF